MITLENLADKLNGRLWEKAEKRRIYLNDAGYNTKKMKTTAYVEEINNNFVVKCFIDCPSQDYNWIKSQQQQVIDSLQERIDDLVSEEEATEVHILTMDDNFVDEYGTKFDAGNPLFEDDIYYSLAKAEEVLEESNLNAEIVTFDKEVWNELCSKFDLDKFNKDQEEINNLRNTKVKEEAISNESPKSESNPVINYEVGKSYKHSKFGIGELTEQSNTHVYIEFPDHGIKNLLKKFVKLQLSE